MIPRGRQDCGSLESTDPLNDPFSSVPRGSKNGPSQKERPVGRNEFQACLHAQVAAHGDGRTKETDNDADENQCGVGHQIVLHRQRKRHPADTLL